MPTQQVAPVHWATFCIGENEIIRLSILRSLPGCFQNRLQDSVRIKRNAPATCIGFRIVELAFVETLYDFDSIRMNSLPTQSTNLTNSHGTNHHQRNDGLGRLRQCIDDASNVLL